ncbi:MAG: squalene synthase HpnC [Ignavibacteria bacterium]|nr:squalene synthase HpnC [Ignavibacteria bacterium]
MAEKFNISIAYKKALHFAKTHYENFPVVSFLIPKELRKDIAIIYWFARFADDLADEGEYTSQERITSLEKFELRFLDTINQKFEADYDAALYSTISTHRLDIKLFLDLISAFIQDIKVTRYQTHEEVLEYCSRSANPVGRLLLQLFNVREEEANIYSDNICTALQLTNFYQDITIDYQKGRIYIPIGELDKFNVTESDIQNSVININFQKLLKFQIERVQEYFDIGYKLIPYLSGLFKYEILLTIKGGETILEKIKKNNYDVFNKRPVISKKDFITILITVLTNEIRFGKRNIEKK